MVIYKAENKINGMIYIGKTIKKLKYRINAHFSSKKINGYFPRAIRKYGVDAFNIIVIDTAQTNEELLEKEKLWIKHYDCRSPKGYNLTDGGEGLLGLKHKDETKIKIGNKHRGKVYSQETRKKISIANTGKKASIETKIKMGNAHRGTKMPETTLKAIVKSNTGRKLTEETRKKISIANTGKIKSPETRSFFSKLFKGRRLTDEWKRKISESRKKTIYTDELRKKLSDANKGKPVSEEKRKKLSIAQTGKKLSEETRIKMSESQKRRFAREKEMT